MSCLEGFVKKDRVANSVPNLVRGGVSFFLPPHFSLPFGFLELDNNDEQRVRMITDEVQ